MAANAIVQGINRGVRTQHDDYITFAPIWRKCRDVDNGEDAMHAAKLSYLAKLKDQDDKDYDAYVKRTPFYNATSRTIGGLIGMLFRRPMILTTPTLIENLLEDVNLQGVPFSSFAEELAEECLIVGRVGVLIDYVQLTDNIDEPITIAKAEVLGLRPTMQMYKTETIINWRHKQINNVWSLCQVVLQEAFTMPAKNPDGTDSEFCNITEPRYRVLDIDNEGFYRNRVFRIDERDRDQLVSEIWPLQNNEKMNFIPFEIVTDDGMTFNIDKPPMIDLININISHYKTSADYEHGCHFTALPTFWIAGYKQPIAEPGLPAEKIYLGSQTALVMPDPQTKVGFVEFTGQGLSTLERNLDRKEQQMAVLGARMIAGEKKAAETATTTAIHRTGENSILSSVSISISQALTYLLQVFSTWAGVEDNAIECIVNKDFLPVAIDGPTLTAYTQTWQAGGLTDEEFFDLIQRGDLVEADVDFAKHKAGENTPMKLAAENQQAMLDAKAASPSNGNLNNPKNPGNAH